MVRNQAVRTRIAVVFRFRDGLGTPNDRQGGTDLPDLSQELVTAVAGRVGASDDEREPLLYFHEVERRRQRADPDHAEAKRVQFVQDAREGAIRAPDQEHPFIDGRLMPRDALVALSVAGCALCGTARSAFCTTLQTRLGAAGFTSQPFAPAAFPSAARCPEASEVSTNIGVVA